MTTDDVLYWMHRELGLWQYDYDFRVNGIDGKSITR